MDLMTATPVTEAISTLIEKYGVTYKRYTHPVCRTSEESFAARAAAGGGEVIGAKAILMKLDPKGQDSEFAVFVLPGWNKVDAKKIKKNLNLKSCRFSTGDELTNLTNGLIPGTMPPFGSHLFPKIPKLYLDEALLEHKQLGFNAGSLCVSITMNTQDLIKVAQPDHIFGFSASDVT